MRKSNLLIAGLFTLVVLGAAACTRAENETDMPGTVAFACNGGLDADCDAQAYAACPNGYENAAPLDATQRQMRVIRCK